MNFCNRCGNEFNLDKNEDACPSCGSKDVEPLLNVRLTDDIFDSEDDYLED